MINTMYIISFLIAYSDTMLTIWIRKSCFVSGSQNKLFIMKLHVYLLKLMHSTFNQIFQRQQKKWQQTHEVYLYTKYRDIRQVSISENRYTKSTYLDESMPSMDRLYITYDISKEVQIGSNLQRGILLFVVIMWYYFSSI